MKRYLIPLLLAVILLMAGYASAENAEIPSDVSDAIVSSGTCGDNLVWALDDQGTLTIYGTGEMYDYDWFGNYTQWYAKNDQIRSVVIQDGVTGIGMAAFRDCAVTNVVIPSSVLRIGDFAFSYCRNLSSVELPYGVTTIGQAAFGGCTMDYFAFPDSVTSVDANVFYNAHIKSIRLPNNTVETPHGSVLYYCFGLEKIYIPEKIGVSLNSWT